jgi:hypothetical protein
MPKISDMGAALARIEHLNEEDALRREKELRNLTQRLPFMPVGREGRADVYDVASLAALRLVQVAADVGVTRPILSRLVSALHETHRADGPSAGKKERVMDRLEARAKAGDRFSVSIDLLPGGDTVVRIGDRPKSETDAIFESAGFPDPIATVEIRADELIRALVGELKAD